MSDYRSFKAGRSSKGIGGNARTSPVRIPIPRDGHGVVVLERMSLPDRERQAIRDIQVREPVDPEGDVLGGQTWDVFISHVSEDKELVAIPLRNALAERGVTVWLDKTELRLGDSLRRKIDRGAVASANLARPVGRALPFGRVEFADN